jgi:hypothetical protein
MDKNITSRNQEPPGSATLRAFGGYDFVKDPGHWSEWTHVITCKKCNNQFTTRDWIRGRRTFTATICNPCADLLDSRPNRKPPASSPEQKVVNFPYKED